MNAHAVDLQRRTAILERAKAELSPAFLSEWTFAEENQNYYAFNDEEIKLYKSYIDDLFEHMLDYSGI